MRNNKRKNNKKQTTNYNIDKNRGIIEETPPTIYPTFENSGSIITDNEYEVKAELNNNNNETCNHTKRS